MNDTKPRRMLLPITEEIRALLLRRLRRYRSDLVPSMFKVTGLLVLLTLLAGATDRQIDGQAWVMGIAMLVGFAVVLLVGLHVLSEWQLWRDLRSGQYVRAIGRVETEVNWDEGHNYYVLKIEGEDLRWPFGEREPAPFGTLHDATIDHTKHARIVLSIQDSEGHYVYRMEDS